jgi:hypothetical protein
MLDARIIAGCGFGFFACSVRLAHVQWLGED